MKIYTSLFSILGMGLLFTSFVLSAAIDPSSAGLVFSISTPSDYSSTDPLAPLSAATDGSVAFLKRYIGDSLANYQANTANRNNFIPDYVLLPRDGSVPGFGFGGRSGDWEMGGQDVQFMFSAQEIWTAMATGYSYLQKAATFNHMTTIPSRDQYATYARKVWPSFALGAGARFPSELRADHLSLFDPAGWPGEFQTNDAVLGGNTRVFTFPIIPQAVFDASTAPGLYRVVFNQDGQYLGVVFIRLGASFYMQHPAKSGDGKDGYAQMGWLGQVDVNGNPKGNRRSQRGGWRYPGTPTTRSTLYNNWLPPFNWQRAADLGGVYADIRYDLSPPPRVQTIDGSSNETSESGVYHITPSNSSASSNSSIFAAGAASKGDFGCDLSYQHVNQTYQSVCWSDWVSGTKHMEYQIVLTGIGIDAQGWCTGILDNMKGECGGHFNLKFKKKSPVCWDRNPGTVTLYHDWTKSRAANAASISYVWGIQMSFTIDWPWAESDADHSCIQSAIEKGSCISHQVRPQFPVVCRQRDYYNASLTEFDYDFQGPA